MKTSLIHVTYILTDYVEQSCSWEANSSQLFKKFPIFYWMWRFIIIIMILPLVFILSQMNLAYTIPYNFSKTHINIVQSSVPVSSKRPVLFRLCHQNFVCFLCRHVLFLVYSGPSKVEHNPFQEAVRLSICSTFELNLPIRNNVNWINPFKISKIYWL